jgi:hypothetical protein
MPPKRRVSGYFLFCNEKRSLVRDQNPHANFTEIVKILGGLWTGLSDAERRSYIERAKQKKGFGKPKTK